jgi:hypothetical protein
MVPSIISLRIHSGNRFKLRLWLPVFILWPFVLILLLIIAPLVLIAEAVLVIRGTPMHLFRMIGGVALVVSSLHGTLVNVDSPEKRTIVKMAIY